MNYTDKASKQPEMVKLYEDNDFITAYSKHTDLRIKEDGPHLAIGAREAADQGWDVHGKLQLDFLIAQGLKPKHRLLDIGCGTGRLARKVVPYLETGNYTGIDISNGAINNCLQLAESEGFADKKPLFILGNGTLKSIRETKFSFVWAHSVFTHNPPEMVEQFFRRLSEMEWKVFLLTFKQTDELKRSGLKQFQYPHTWFFHLGHKYGFKLENLDKEWPSSQKAIKVTR